MSFICNHCENIRYNLEEGEWFCAAGHDLDAATSACPDLDETEDPWDLTGFNIDLEQVKEIEF